MMDDRQVVFSSTGHRDGVRPIGQALIRFEAALQEAFKREVHDLTYHDLKSNLTVQLGQDKQFREEMVVQYMVEDALTFPRVNHALCRVQSCAFLILAEQALKLGDEAVAWYFLSEGQYRHGVADGTYRAEFAPKQRQARASKGGKRSSENSGSPEIKKECIRPLKRAKRPVGRRWTQVAAIEAILPMLETFVTDSKIDLGENHDLHTTVQRWLAADSDVRAAHKGIA